MSGARSKLLNTANFGPAGTVSTRLSILDTFSDGGSITEQRLESLNADVLFIGAFNVSALTSNNKQFTEAEIDATHNWSLTPGNTALIFEAARSNNSFYEKWGYQLTESVSNPNRPAWRSRTNPLFNALLNGPFGRARSFDQGGSIQAYFSKMPRGVVVLAVNSIYKPVLVYDPTTQDFLAADVDLFTDLGQLSPNPNASTDADKLWLNLFSLLHEHKQGNIIFN